VYIYALYVHFEEKILYVACVKKKFCDPKIAIDVVFYPFYTNQKEMSFLRKTLWVNIECSDVHLEFFSYFY
jgi:hypothetical protein